MWALNLEQLVESLCSWDILFSSFFPLYSSLTLDDPKPTTKYTYVQKCSNENTLLAEVSFWRVFRTYEISCS